MGYDEHCQDQSMQLMNQNEINNQFGVERIAEFADSPLRKECL